jgi:hypothetical protein
VGGKNRVLVIKSRHGNEGFAGENCRRFLRHVRNRQR